MSEIFKAPLPWTTNDLLYSILLATGGEIATAPLGWTSNDLLHSMLVGGAVAGSGGGGTGADPTALVRLLPTAGVATTFMRSDAAPALAQDIAPVWTARHLFHGNGAADITALGLTGIPFVGGTTTTTKPLMLIEPAGTPSTGFSTTGTMFGINTPATYGGTLIYGKRGAAGPFYNDLIALYAGSTKIMGLRDDGLFYIYQGLYTGNDTILLGAVTGGAYGGLSLGLGMGIGFRSAAAGYGASDTALVRLGPANLRQGLPPSATPLAQTFTIGEASRPGTDSNIGGANGTIQSGLGTGTGTPSTLNFQTPTAAVAGSATQTYTTRMRVDQFGVTFPSATGSVNDLIRINGLGSAAPGIAAGTNATGVIWQLYDTGTGTTARLAFGNLGGITWQSTNRVDAGVVACQITVGIGTPEAVVTAGVGSLFLRTDGGASTTLYVKQSGTGNTGWVAK